MNTAWPGCSACVPHQQQGDHADVARIVGGDPDRRGAGVGIRAAGGGQPLAGGHDRGDERARARATAGREPGGSQDVLADRIRRAAASGSSSSHPQGTEQGRGVGGGAQARPTSNGVRA